MFTFNIRAEKHMKEDCLQIRIYYKWSDELHYSTIVEIVPKERFCSDEQFSRYVLDSLIDKAKQNASERLTLDIKHKLGHNL